MNAAGNSTFAWEPLTPRGVASFAHARLGRLLFVQFIAALLVAASVAWFLHDSVFPVIRKAITNLPVTGEIRSAQLTGHDGPPKLLAEGRFLALDVDLDHSGKINSTADERIEFGRKTIWTFGLLGYMEFPYPDIGPLPFNQTDLEPLWGAWRAELLFIAVVATVMALLVSWWLLATVYCLPAWLIGFFVNRDLNFRRSWKLSGAALLPGALLMAAGVWLYDFDVVNLVQFGFIFGAHFVLGWIYLFVSLLFVPGISVASPKNPFAGKK
jgi:hypothetical protein